MQARILWIERKRAESSPFIPALLEKGYLVEVVPTGEKALTTLSEFKPNIAIIKASSRRNSGKNICRMLEERSENLPIILIAEAPEQEKIVTAKNRVELSLPLTPQELITQITEYLPKKGCILWIYEKQSKPYITILIENGFQVEAVSTGSIALEWFINNNPDITIINAASMNSSGEKIFGLLNNYRSNKPFFIITKAVSLKKADNNVIRPYEELILPFTFRKLLNRINYYLPIESNKLLKLGPIQLDLERHQLKLYKRKSKLTPRLTHLLQILMLHPGEVLERERLFREVWSTEYTEDTRTLDVHISWLRRALEEDPRHPKFLKTMRGVGYRLDIEPIPGSPARMSPGRP